MQMKFMSWKKWRIEELWTWEVSDLLEINQKGLRKVFKLIASAEFLYKKNRLPSVNKREPSIDQCTTVLGKGAMPRLNES